MHSSTHADLNKQRVLNEVLKLLNRTALSKLLKVQIFIGGVSKGGFRPRPSLVSLLKERSFRKNSYCSNTPSCRFPIQAVSYLDSIL